jgi:hypothetical protein
VKHLSCAANKGRLLALDANIRLCLTIYQHYSLSRTFVNTVVKSFIILVPGREIIKNLLDLVRGHACSKKILSDFVQVYVISIFLLFKLSLKFLFSRLKKVLPMVRAKVSNPSPLTAL